MENFMNNRNLFSPSRASGKSWCQQVCGFKQVLPVFKMGLYYTIPKSRGAVPFLDRRQEGKSPEHSSQRQNQHGRIAS